MGFAYDIDGIWGKLCFCGPVAFMSAMHIQSWPLESTKLAIDLQFPIQTLTLGLHRFAAKQWLHMPLCLSSLLFAVGR